MWDTPSYSPPPPRIESMGLLLERFPPMMCSYITAGGLVVYLFNGWTYAACGMIWMFPDKNNSWCFCTRSSHLWTGRSLRTKGTPTKGPRVQYAEHIRRPLYSAERSAWTVLDKILSFGVCLRDRDFPFSFDVLELAFVACFTNAHSVQQQRLQGPVNMQRQHEPRQHFLRYV